MCVNASMRSLFVGSGTRAVQSRSLPVEKNKEWILWNRLKSTVCVLGTVRESGHLVGGTQDGEVFRGSSEPGSTYIRNSDVRTRVEWLAVDPLAEYVAVCQGPGYLRLLALGDLMERSRFEDTAELLTPLNLAELPRRVAFAPDGSLLAASNHRYSIDIFERNALQRVKFSIDVAVELAGEDNAEFLFTTP